MIIRKMTARFGCLENSSLELDEGLNIISAPNESGKSTWCAFIRAMLYGIDSARREKGGVKPDKLRYAPWSGLPMSGEMEISHGGRLISLRRDTKSPSAPMRSFSACYTGTAEPVPGLSGSDAGLILTGMPRAVFESSVFVPQGGLEVSSSDELENRIKAIVASGDSEGRGFGEAEAQLRQWQRRRRHNRSGALPALESEIDEKRAAMEAVEEEFRRFRELEARLAAAEKAVAEAQTAAERHAEAGLAGLETLRLRLAELERLRGEALREALRAEGEREKGPFGGMSAAEALREGRRESELLAKLGRAVPGPTAGIILLLSGALAAAAGVFSHFALYILGAALILGGVLCLLLRRGKRREAEKFAGAMARRYGSAGSEAIMAAAEAHASACAAAERAKKALADAESETDSLREELRRAENALLSRGGGNERLARLREERELLRRSLARSEGALQAMGDPMVIAAELDALLSRRTRLTEQYEAIDLALDCLREADSELRQRYAPELGRRAGELLSRLTGGRYEALSFDRSLDSAARPEGDILPREKAFLSAGTVDQIYLALRLAICEPALHEGESCPLILDDALVNFDDERMALAIELLKEIAKERQVILFTCHDREKAYLGSH